MKGYRTIIFNVLIGLVAIAEKTVADLGISNGWLVTVLTVGNLVLRAVTTTAIGTPK
jgi:hypothetical protein